jgi:hypothetical protein
MYAQTDSVIGLPPLGFGGLVADATPRVQPGNFITMVDNYWGAGEFIYLRANGTIRMLGICTILQVFDSTLGCWRWDATEVPNTAGLGRELAVAMNAMTAGQYGWFCISGLVPVNCQAAVAADTTFGIAAAGQGGANSAGKQILNARVVGASSATVVKANCAAASGSLVLQVPNSDGWFEGVFLSGTGIQAATTVVSIDPTGRFVTLSLATSAAVAGSVTATYNNATIFYNVAQLNRPFAQGAIT